MKSHTVIAGANGELIITSTTEHLRIPASQILPGDWLLKPHRRGFAKDKFVEDVMKAGICMRVAYRLGGEQSFLNSQMVDVERTT